MIKKISFTPIVDSRGSLIAIEEPTIGFTVKRIYYIYGANSATRRGYHAHLNLKQFFICISGSCKIQFEEDSDVKVINFNSNDKGVYVEGIVWREIYDFSNDCILLVLASEVYNEEDYIRDYKDFKKLSN